MIKPPQVKVSHEKIAENQRFSWIKYHNASYSGNKHTENQGFLFTAIEDSHEDSTENQCFLWNNKLIIDVSFSWIN